MKKILTASIITLAFLGVAGIASAATISLSPSASTVTTGQTFTVLISVNAGTDTVSTVKAAVSYPQELLTPTAFTFANGSAMWVPLAQPGYDQMGDGLVIKTAGFPGGFTGAKTLGTITFSAKKAGTAALAVGDKSVAYDTENRNVLSGAQGSAALTIEAPAPTAPPPPPLPAQIKPAAETKPDTVEEPLATEVEEEATTSVVSVENVNVTNAQVAAAGESSSAMSWIWGGVTLVALAALAWLLWRRRRF